MMKTSGYINKQGQNNMLNLAFWPERYFVLEGNCFSYYLDDTKTDLRGVYRLGKDDTVTAKDGVLCLTSTFYKTHDQFSFGLVQKLNMKLGDKKDFDRWHKMLRTIIKYTQDSPHHPGSCSCGNVEWAVFGKCVAEATCHCSDCSFYQSISPLAMFTQGNWTLSKGSEYVQTRKSSRPDAATVRCFCKECHTFCFANFPAYGTTGVPLDRLFVEGKPPLLSRSRPKFHIHYASKRVIVNDSQLKYFDLPSTFGGSGNVVDSSGEFVGNDIQGEKLLQVQQLHLKEALKEEKQETGVAVAQKEGGSRQLALVTSGHQGVGLEVCKQLAASGYHVVMCGPDAEGLGKVAEKVRAAGGEGRKGGAGVEVECLVLDPTSEASVASALEMFSLQHDHLDVLVNVTVGGGGGGGSTPGTLDAAKDSLELHFFSAWRVTQAFAPLLKAAGRGSRVVMAVNDSTGTASATHQLSMMAAHALTVQFASELRDDEVMVNSTCSRARGEAEVSGAETGTVSEDATSVVWAATLPPGGPTGGFFRDGKPMNF